MSSARLIALTLLCVVIIGGSALAEEITLTTHDLCPYGCYDADGNFDGHAVRVVRYALEQMEFSLNLVVVPWKRAQDMVQFGEADGFFAGSQNADRDKNGVMSAIIAEQKWNWYLLKSNPLDPRSPDFKEKAKVTSFIGANMLKWLKENDYNVVPSPTTTNCLAQMLVVQRFDAMLANNMVMNAIIHSQGMQNKFKSYTLKDKPLGVYFSNRFVADHPDFVEEFNRHVRKYRKNNPYQQSLP